MSESNTVCDINGNITNNADFIKTDNLATLFNALHGDGLFPATDNNNLKAINGIVVADVGKKIKVKDFIGSVNGKAVYMSGKLKLDNSFELITIPDGMIGNTSYVLVTANTMVDGTKINGKGRLLISPTELDDTVTLAKLVIPSGTTQITNAMIDNTVKEFLPDVQGAFRELSKKIDDSVSAAKREIYQFLLDNHLTSPAILDEIAQGDNAVRAELDSKVLSLQNQINDTESSVAVITDNLYQFQLYMNSQVSGLSSRSTALEQSITQLNNTVSENSAFIDDLKTRVTAAEGQLVAALTEIDVIKADILNLRTVVDTSVQDAKREIYQFLLDNHFTSSEVLDEIAQGNSEIRAELDSRLSSIQSQIADVNVSIVDIRGSIIALRAYVDLQIQTLDIRTLNLTNAIEQLNSIVLEDRQFIEDLGNRITISEGQMVSVLAQLDMINAAVISEQNTRSIKDSSHDADIADLQGQINNITSEIGSIINSGAGVDASSLAKIVVWLADLDFRVSASNLLTLHSGNGYFVDTFNDVSGIETSLSSGHTVDSAQHSVKATTTGATTTTTTTLIEAEDPLVIETGTWIETINSASSGGKELIASNDGASLSFSFEGQQVSLVYPQRADQAKVVPVIDGTSYPEINLSGSLQNQKKVIIANGLTSGSHTLTLTSSGTNSSGSGGSGTTPVNIALGKPIVAAFGGFASTSLASNTVDGNVSTRWNPYGSANPYYAVIDLGSPQEISKFSVFYNDEGSAAYPYNVKTVKVYTSPDSNPSTATFTLATTITTSAPEGFYDGLVSLTGVRLVKYELVENFIAGGRDIVLYEFQIWGVGSTAVSLKTTIDAIESVKTVTTGSSTTTANVFTKQITSPTPASSVLVSKKSRTTGSYNGTIIQEIYDSTGTTKLIDVTSYDVPLTLPTPQSSVRLKTVIDGNALLDDVAVVLMA